MRNILKIVFIATLVTLLMSITILPVTASKPRYFIGTVKELNEESSYHGCATSVNVIVLTIPIKVIRSGETIEYDRMRICKQLLNGNYLMLAGLWVD